MDSPNEKKQLEVYIHFKCRKRRMTQNRWDRNYHFETCLSDIYVLFSQFPIPKDITIRILVLIYFTDYQETITILRFNKLNMSPRGELIIKSLGDSFLK